MRFPKLLKLPVAAKAAALIRRPGGLPALSLPGGVSLWVSLLSFGFLLAALIAHGRQMLQLSLDLQGWLWLVLGVGLSLLSLLANGAGLGVVLRWLGLRPRWAGLLVRSIWPPTCVSTCQAASGI
jgi:hypothetical protein